MGGFKCLGYEHIASGCGLSNLGSASSQLDTVSAPAHTPYRLKKAPQRKHGTRALEEEPRRRIASDELHSSVSGVRADPSVSLSSLFSIIDSLLMDFWSRI